MNTSAKEQSDVNHAYGEYVKSYAALTRRFLILKILLILPRAICFLPIVIYSALLCLSLRLRRKAMLGKMEPGLQNATLSFLNRVEPALERYSAQ